MALRLRVISDHRQRLGDKSTFVFGVSGGSIGRSAENDWVLPDDMRYVSGRHARIVYHKGRYLLQDTSSNGTYVNDIEKPLGNQNPHELKSGDILRIGEYHVQVQIDSSNDFSLDDSALYKKHSGSTSTRRRAPPSALGASLRLANPLQGSNQNSHDEPPPPPRAPAPRPRRPAPGAGGTPSGAQQSPRPAAPKAARVPGRRRAR